MLRRTFVERVDFALGAHVELEALAAVPHRRGGVQRAAAACDIVKDVRGSESNCEHDSRKM